MHSLVLTVKCSLTARSLKPFHDTDIDTDTDTNIVMSDDPREDVGNDVSVGVDVVECDLYYTYFP